MSTPRQLAEAIERYLREADDGSPPAGSSTTISVSTPAASDGNGADTSKVRQQVQDLAQTTEQLKKNNKKLTRELDALKNNMQMSALLPLLMDQKLVTTNAPAGIPIKTEFDFKNADMLTALLPALLMSDGGGSGSGFGGSNMGMLLAAVALSSSGGSSVDTPLLLALAFMSQNQPSSSDE